MRVEIPDLFEISGYMELNNAELRGVPLKPAQLFAVLDLSRPGLEAVKAAADRGDAAAAARALLNYFQARKDPWPRMTPSAWWGDIEYLAGNGAKPNPRVPRLKASAEDYRLADSAARHIFEVRAPVVHDYGPDIDWDWDPANGDYWTCNMHYLMYGFQEQTRCYSASGDEKYAQTWIDLTADWIRKNPLTAARLPFPQSWYSAAVGCRISIWAFNLAYYLDSAACTPEFIVLLLTSLYNHARRSYWMPYLHDDNFATGESFALALAGFVFPEFQDSAKWRESGVARFSFAADKQFYSDGVIVELALAYHLSGIDIFLDLIERCRGAGLRPLFTDRVEAMANVVLGMSAPDRKLFRCNDSERVDASNILKRTGVFFERPDLLAVGGCDAANYPERRNFAFPRGGFYAFRSDWSAQAVWLALHCGPKGDGFHAQYDNGTFELMAFGRLVMRDPGYFLATGDFRESLRRTAAHQTLTLDGKNSARMGRLLHWQEDDRRGNASLTVENAAYPGLIHRRTVFFVDGKYFVLLDEALGDAEGAIELHFQLTPGPATFDPATKSARTAFETGGNVLVWSPPDAPVALIEEAAVASPEYAKKEPLPALLYRHAQRKAPVRFLTVLAPFKDAEVPRSNARIAAGEIGGNAVEVALDIAGKTYRVAREF